MGTKKLFLALSLLLISLAAMGQTMDISGTVVDRSGVGIIGVSVLEKGTTNGVDTDLDGNFRLTVKAGSIIQFSLISYETQELPAAAQMRVILEEDSEMLEETVVVGYGVQKKSDVTGSISSVKSEDMENRTVNDLGSALQGKVAGLQILSTSGAPGAGSTFRIRGYSSNGSSDPLYIVDGLKVRSIDYLDVENIESIEVLKDAASAAIYGAEAGNGVVLITTKTAKRGEGSFFYNNLFSFQQVANYPDVLNASEYLEYQDLLGNTNVREAYDGVTDTNWADEVFETGQSMRHTFGFRGGNDRGSLYISLSSNTMDGMIYSDKDTFDRLTLQVNGDYKVKSWMRVTSNISMEKAETRSVSQSNEAGSAISSILMHDPITPVVYDMNNLPAAVYEKYYNQGKPYLTDPDGNIYGVSQVCESQNYNPFIAIDQADGKSQRFNINGSLSAIFTPLKNLTYTSRVGYRISSSYSTAYDKPFYVNDLRAQTSEYLDASSSGGFFIQFENFVNYNFNIKKNNIAIMAGMSYEENNSHSVNGSTYSLQSTAENFRYLNYSTADADDSVGGTENRSANISYFGRIGWSYANRYNIMVNFRADAFDTSKLSRKARWGYFPSVSAGWNVSNEKFFTKNLKQYISFLKLRASYGINGNVNALGSYAYSSNMSTGNNYNLTSAGLTTGIYPGLTLANPDLRWEESRQVDLGLESRFFRDRLNFSVDYYSKNTEGLLVRTTPALSTGTTYVYKNAGVVHNDGLEFELGWKDTHGDFAYGISANLSTINNIVKVGPSTNRINGASIQSAGTITYFEEGYPVWYVRGYEIDHVDDEGVPHYKTADGGTSTAPTDEDKVMIGSAIPDFTYGITLTASYKNFDLTVFGNGVSGNELYLGVKRGDYTTLNTLKVFHDKDNKMMPAPQHQATSLFLESSGMMYDASYFKLSQIQLGYRFPAKWMKKIHISSLRLFASVENALTITKYPGLDPETRSNSTSGMAIDRGAYPASRRYSFGLNLSF